MNTHFPPPLQAQPESAAILVCWSCGTRFSRGICANRFCSERCRDWFDAGNPRHGEPSRGHGPWRIVAGGDPGYLPKTDYTIVACAGCGQAFASRGLHCCSPACEKRHRESVEILETLAEVGIVPTERRRCAGCGRDIPRFRGAGRARRAVSKATRFCSDRCAQKARRAQDASHPRLTPEE